MKLSMRAALAAAFSSLLCATAAFGQPANDTCVGAEVIPGTGPFPWRSSIVDITNATVTNDPSPSCQSNFSRGVWYEFTPTATGSYTFSTCTQAGGGTTLSDTVVAVFDGTSGCGGALSQVTCDDDGCVLTGTQSSAVAQLTAGTTYYVLVYKYNQDVPSPGQGLVQLEVTPGSTNDVCGGAPALSLNQPVWANTAGMTNDYQLPSSAACFSANNAVGNTTSSATGRDAVWSFTAPAAGNYSFRVHRWNDDDPNPVLYLSDACPASGSPTTVSSCVAAANRTGANSSGSLAEEIPCHPMGAGDTVWAIVDESSLTTPDLRSSSAACRPPRSPSSATPSFWSSHRHSRSARWT